jgi:hypothetical protein
MLTHLVQAGEEVGVEHLLPIAAVESLNVGVLIGLAGLDVADLDAVGLAPVGVGLGEELGPVVAAERFGGAPRSDTSRSRTRTTRAAGKFVSTSIARPSRTPSSITFNVRNRRP